MLYKAQYMNTNPAMMANWFSSCAGQIFQKPCFLVQILWPHRFDLVHMYEIRPTAANFQIRSFYKIMTDHQFSPCTQAWFTHETTTSGRPMSMLILIHLGRQCRQMCLSAAPIKRQTFLSVADMSEMSSRHFGDIPCYVGHFFGCRRRVGETYCRNTHLHVRRNQYWWGSHNIQRDKKNWHPLRFCIHSQVRTYSK